MNWYEIANAGDVPSPALLLHSDRIDANLRRMIEMAGGPGRLRPHVKTHKLGELTRRQLALGITKYKCATIAEAEVVAEAHGPDVLLAYQPVGPQIQRLVALQKRYPETSFSALVDSPAIVADLGAEAVRHGATIRVWVDLDIGHHRTGIAPGPEALALVQTIGSTGGVELAGLHAYDGHIHDSDVAARRKAYDKAFAPVDAFKQALGQQGIQVPAIVAGGTPTFPFHAAHPGIECSPGTVVLWDAGYGTNIPDLGFLPAAVLLARVVSKPSANRLCIDLGHKAVASEMPHPRVILQNVPEARPVIHSEEHLVVETPAADRFRVGDVVYGIPWHICPTVALHQEVWVIHEGRATERWPIPARGRRLTV